MPQMAPLNWLILFIIIIITFIIINTMNYFIFSNNPIKKYFKMFSKKNWKW